MKLEFSCKPKAESSDSYLLVAIGRMENQYAREFVEHHRGIGFSKIVVCDNNYRGEEHFEDVLADYIASGFVEVLDYRDRSVIQLQAYTECYARYGSQYAWIAFFDFDEFLMLSCNSVDEFLADKTGFDCVMINWMVMTDSGLVRNDGRPLMERFTEPLPFDKGVQYAFPEDMHVKSIVRGGIAGMVFHNPHMPGKRVRCCNASGKQCRQSPFQEIDFTHAHLKHFATKTAEEWATRKMRVGTPDRPMDKFLKAYEGRFFKYNEWSPSKAEILNPPPIPLQPTPHTPLPKGWGV